MEHSLTIIQSTNRTALSQCSISNAQINTFNGWTDINASTFELTSDAKLKVCQTYKNTLLHYLHTH